MAKPSPKPRHRPWRNASEISPMVRKSMLTLKVLEGRTAAYVEFFVDGVNLREMIVPAFRRPNYQATISIDDCLPWTGWDYELSDTVLGEAARTNSTQAILFACGCGHVMCSGTYVDVVVEPDTIAFHNFTRVGDSEPLDVDPIVFDRAHFEAAVRELEAVMIPLHQPPPQPERNQITPPPGV